MENLDVVKGCSTNMLQNQLSILNIDNRKNNIMRQTTRKHLYDSFHLFLSLLFKVLCLIGNIHFGKNIHPSYVVVYLLYLYLQQ